MRPKQVAWLRQAVDPAVSHGGHTSFPARSSKPRGQELCGEEQGHGGLLSPAACCPLPAPHLGNFRGGPGPHDLAGSHPLSVLPGFSAPSAFSGIALPPTSLLQEALLLPLTLEHAMLAPDTQQKPSLGWVPWLSLLEPTAPSGLSQGGPSSWPMPAGPARSLTGPWEPAACGRWATHGGGRCETPFSLGLLAYRDTVWALLGCPQTQLGKFSCPVGVARNWVSRLFASLAPWDPEILVGRKQGDTLRPRDLTGLWLSHGSVKGIPQTFAGRQGREDWGSR